MSSQRVLVDGKGPPVELLRELIGILTRAGALCSELPNGISFSLNGNVVLRGKLQSVIGAATEQTILHLCVNGAPRVSLIEQNSESNKKREEKMEVKTVLEALGQQGVRLKSYCPENGFAQLLVGEKNIGSIEPIKHAGKGVVITLTFPEEDAKTVVPELFNTSSPATGRK